MDDARFDRLGNPDPRNDPTFSTPLHATQWSSPGTARCSYMSPRRRTACPRR